MRLLEQITVSGQTTKESHNAKRAEVYERNIHGNTETLVVDKDGNAIWQFGDGDASGKADETYNKVYHPV